MVTTHFNEIKKFAAVTPGFENARMEFDAETLQPLYKLTIGEAGSSYAFYIALKLGMPPQLVERSKQTAMEAAQCSPDAEETPAVKSEITPAPQAAVRPEKRDPAQPGFAVGDCV